MAGEFLGTGWAFPVRIDGTTGRVALSSNERDIEESIRLILFTAKGERIMRPEFGCGIHDFVFDSMNTTMIGLAESSVREALTRWEPRIEVLEVTAAQDSGYAGRLMIHIRYAVRTTNQLFNLVYPFYLREG
ncbi:GPW/gp25 family protein [Paenibacillus sp. HJGM_3]|uniref:GPW/gp25 family protein n=1 Tax=Paenibacillus sp. HJGM_3 TaxID=3379816 RepID=UPI003859DA53